MYIYVYEPVNWQIPTELPIYVYFTIRKTASKTKCLHVRIHQYTYGVYKRRDDR